MARVPFQERRVSPAGIADTSIRVRADGEDFGSQVGGSLARLGAQGVDAAQHQFALAQRRQAEVDKKELNERLNAYQEERGRAAMAFEALKGNAVTEKARDEHLAKLDEIAAKHRTGLDERVGPLFDTAVSKDRVGQRLGAEQHFMRQTAAAAEQARVANVQMNISEAVVSESGFSAALARGRAIDAVNADPALAGDAASRKLAIQAVDGAILEGRVARLVQEGRVNEAEAEGKRALAEEGFLNAEARARVTARLESATFARDTDRAARTLLAEAAKEFPGGRIEDIDARAALASDTLERELLDGKIDQRTYDARRQVLVNHTSREQDRVRKATAAFLGNAEERLAAAGTLDAAKLWIDTQTPEGFEWMKPTLEHQALKLYAADSDEAQREERRRESDPANVFKSEALLMGLIQNDGFASKEQLIQEANLLKLPTSSINKLAKAYDSGGMIGQIGQDAIRRNLPQSMVEEIEKNSDQLFALQDIISQDWPADKPVDDKAIRERIALVVMEGRLGHGRGGKSSYLEAVAAGKEAEWRPVANLSEEQIAATEEQMVQARNRLMALADSLQSEGKVDEARELRRKAFELGPAPFEPTLRVRRDISPRERSRALRPEGFVDGQPDPALFEEQTDLVRDPQAVLDQANAFIATQHGIPVGLTREEYKELNATALRGELRQAKESRANELRAVSQLYDFISSAQFRGTVGVEAVMGNLEAHLRAKDSAPAWLNEFRAQKGLKPLDEELAALSQDERRLRIRREAYEAVGQVTR